MKPTPPKIELRQAGEGTLYPRRWFLCHVAPTQDSANNFMLENPGWGLLNEAPDGFLLAQLTDEGFTKKIFAVTDGGETFGILTPDRMEMQVLMSHHLGQTKMGITIPHFQGIRPASLADFERFRIEVNGYQQDPEHYEMPES